MKTVYGAPSTGVPISKYEADCIKRDGTPYSRELMLGVLHSFTEDEYRLKESRNSALDYDYGAFRLEDCVFAEGNVVHILRHLRYDRHEVHSHRFFEIVCQVSGEGSAEISGQRIGLFPGTVCLLSPGTPHRLEAYADDSVILKIIMRRSDFDGIYSHMLRSNSLLTNFFRCSLYGGDGGSGWLLFETGGDADVLDTLLRMRYHEIRASLTDCVMKEALVMQLFCYLVSNHVDKTRASFGSDSAGKILVYISENFKTVTLSGLAEEFHFSGNYISRIVRRASGKSFTDLVCGLRLEHACRLLENTDLTVQEIMADSGFGCKEFFYKKFREYKGIPPLKWRQKAMTE